MAKKTRKLRCSRCSQLRPRYDIVHYVGVESASRQLCSRCLNSEIAEADGLDKFEHLNFEPVRLTDCSGKPHDFHFRTRLFGTGVALDAFEIRDGQAAGYQFQVIGDPEMDLLVLLGRLIDKIRRALTVEHVTYGEFGWEIKDAVVRGRIDWDDDHQGRVPLVTVDGREITWEDFGHMLMTFEGWQFKLEIRDRSDEF